MKHFTILLAIFCLCSCGNGSSDSEESEQEDKMPSATRIIRYQFDGETPILVFVTDFGGVADKTVEIGGEKTTVGVEIDEFNDLWNAQSENSLIERSLLGEEFSGIDSETHHIISFVVAGSTPSDEMAAVLASEVTAEFEQWLARLLQTEKR